VEGIDWRVLRVWRLGLSEFVLDDYSLLKY
jgi:hypothetical protein